MENHLFYPFSMGKLTNFMVIFNSHVKLPEGTTWGSSMAMFDCQMVAIPDRFTGSKTFQWSGNVWQPGFISQGFTDLHRSTFCCTILCWWNQEVVDVTQAFLARLPLSHTGNIGVCQKNVFANPSKWGFPKLGVPPNHPAFNRFSIINHPYWYPIYGTP